MQTYYYETEKSSKPRKMLMKEDEQAIEWAKRSDGVIVVYVELVDGDLEVVWEKENVSERVASLKRLFDETAADIVKQIEEVSSQEYINSPEDTCKGRNLSFCAQDLNRIRETVLVQLYEIEDSVRYWENFKRR